jgi:hypothetical protein
LSESSALAVMRLLSVIATAGIWYSLQNDIMFFRSGSFLLNAIGNVPNPTE